MFATPVRALLLLFAIALPVAGTAQGVSGADTATRAAHQFLQQQTRDLGTEVNVTVDDPAARLPPCADPQPFLPGSGQPLLGRVTIGVRCGDGQVRYLSARVTAIGSYWVASQGIPAQAIVRADMLEQRSGDLARLPHGAIRESSEAIGKITTRFLAQGSVVLDSALKTPALVHRRQPVTVEAVGRGFRVSRQGTALQDGGMGDSVRVRMTDRSVLAGVVSGKSLVEVSF